MTDTDGKTLIIAEMSANHCGSLDKAKALVVAAGKAGADAIKLQTYTAEGLTVNSDKEWFIVKNAAWAGETLYDLYARAYTPWPWHRELKALAEGIGLEFFSTPFSYEAVDYLEELGVGRYKIASMELCDFDFVEYVARRKKPIIMSTGMSTMEEIQTAVETIRVWNDEELILLQCTSAYPSKVADANLNKMLYLRDKFDCRVGVSDHAPAYFVPMMATAMGGTAVEKHFILNKDDPSPDALFSLDPAGFSTMVAHVRLTEAARGDANVEILPSEVSQKKRSLFVVRDMQAGEPFTEFNLRSIRPSDGLAPKHYGNLLNGAVASVDIKKYTPLDWDMVMDKEIYDDAEEEKDALPF